ncbi:MAG: SDR family oxidoreductase, partial [Phycisphaerae bacterium]|nr:SDR family oxidoreductase [Phycisphaerae bacterium]
MRQDLKIAVTGSSGFVGSALVRKLAEVGAEVIEVDLAGGIDITDWTQVKNLPRFDVLMHLAAKTFVPDSYENPRDFYFTNVVSTMNVLELCRQREARMVFTSSYVYGRPRRLPIDESHPLAAFNPYAQTKLIGEALCEGYHRDFDLRIVILRPFNIYGPKQSGPFLIPTIINQAESGKIVLKDPDPRRDLLYRDDVVNAYVRAAEYTRAPFEVFN